METAFWIVNGLLALAFLGAGLMKLARSREALADSGMAWAGDFSAGAVKAIALAEVVGAVGLILPPLLDIAPVLAPIAAICLGLMMVGAIVVHVRRHENPAPPVVLALLCVASAVLGFATLS